MPVQILWKWKVTGDGKYFSPFWVEATDFGLAQAKARDILAGKRRTALGDSTESDPETYADKHIISIVRDEW